jgi:putative transposase
MQTQYQELTDSQWEVMNKLLPVQRKRKYDLRRITNAIFWLHRTGCQWRNLPPNYPPWKSVYYYFRRWTKEGIWQNINDELVELERMCNHKELEASLMCADSQSVKLAPFINEERGFDGNKKINGRKRHILVDTLGLIIGVLVTAANVADGKAGCLLLKRCSDKFGRIKKILVDGVYTGTFMDFATTEFNIEVEISSRPPSTKGFVPIKKRWVNERSFGWLNFFRRLDKDHEKSTKSSESMILIANIQIILGRFEYS